MFRFLAILLCAAVAAPAADDLDKQLKTFVDAFAIVEANAADPISSEQAFYQGAIPGLLRKLDPHSVFFDPGQFDQLKKMESSTQKGFGTIVTIVPGRVVVLQTTPGTPSAKSGLAPGDAIIAINNYVIARLDLEQLSELLSESRQHPAQLDVMRPGSGSIMRLILTPEEMQTSSVERTFFIGPGIGYLHVTSFDENTGKDIRAAIEKLGGEKLSGLVLDLRGNPGGVVTAALETASMFLQPGQTVFTIRGRNVPEKAEKVPESAKPYPCKLVVLVNEKTASASEIVSGALQDHDRAWILGDTTFGKGLVQAQFPLSEDSALLLTIAHYYTPSGRLIQRDYQNKSFYEYITRRGAQSAQTEVKATDSGRKVFGGGGISPDEKYTFPAIDQFQRRVASSGAVFHFGSVYFGAAPPALPSPTWTPDANAFDRFAAYLNSQQIAFTDEEFAANRKWVGDLLRRELLMRAFDNKTSVRAAIMEDPEVLKAIESMPKAQALLSSRGPTQRASLK
jgi:carboxyl-terminal processing protease